ncbi:MAG: helix-turn-helix domain-containing protein [Deltaproteobacteria bacterium]|nr:helix-turn-helix domain-containing protein [Deltaproteobacteria bacterium]
MKPESPTLEKLYTPEEAAAVLRVKPRTIMEWLRQGKLKGVKLGGKLWRIREADLRAFIEQGQ